MRLPGDPPREAEIASMIRVNQAGEYGAVRICAGQLKVLGRGPGAGLVREMARQEQEHLDTFTAMLSRRGVRPTLLGPLWHAGGLLMGIATALPGRQTAMACVEAVESVIDAHYAAQLRRLDEMEAAGEPAEPELRDVITRFRADEREHHDLAVGAGARKSPFHRPVMAVVRGVTRAAIRLSSRL